MKERGGRREVKERRDIVKGKLERKKRYKGRQTEGKKEGV